MLKDYVQGKQTYAQLAQREKVGKRTIQRRLDKSELLQAREEIKPGRTVILMDTTYFHRTFGVMVWRDWYRKKNLQRRYLKYETIAEYKAGIVRLQEQGWTIVGIVCDGRRGLLGGFSGIPTQMCHFHQKQIIQRYITKNPRLEAGKELKEIMKWLSITDRENFTELLRRWHERWKEFLSEKTNDQETGRWHYTHKRIRSAYRSLKTNLPYLYTYLDYPDLKIPNTTNSLEGTFSHIDTMLRLHNGMKKERKIKVVDSLLFC